MQAMIVGNNYTHKAEFEVLPRVGDKITIIAENQPEREFDVTGIKHVLQGSAKAVICIMVRNALNFGARRDLGKRA